jgi:hypothetical protein
LAKEEVDLIAGTYHTCIGKCNNPDNENETVSYKLRPAAEASLNRKLHPGGSVFRQRGVVDWLLDRV